MAYEVKTQYLENPTKFENSSRNINEADDSEIQAAEVGPMGAFEESHMNPQSVIESDGESEH